MSDYTDIQPELDDFENAVYGEEVRGSMVSAIKKIHDIAESAADAPDATTATAGQAPIADGAGGWQWGDVATSGDSVPTEVRQAIFNLLDNNAFANDDTYTADLAVLASWATEITSISVSPTTLNINGMNQQTIVATTQPAGGAVTWSSSDESIATVAGGVVTPTGVNGSCTITASCGGKSATCAVTVSGFATLLSINAVYTQSGTVYDTDTLDSLKSDLVVTANFDDGRSIPVTDYTLQGELTAGTSTIIVVYGGKTDTFDVTVSVVEEPVDGAYTIWDARDYATGNVWTDRINSITATPSGNPVKSERAVLFGGTNDYFDFGSMGTIPTSQGVVTIQASFRLNDLTKSAFIMAEGFILSLRPQVSQIQAKSGTYEVNPTYAFDEDWHLLTAVLGQNNQYIYVDNVLVEHLTTTFTNVATVLKNARSLKIGAYPEYSSYSNMYIRSIYIYPKVLSAEDVAYQYSLEKKLWG